MNTANPLGLIPVNDCILIKLEDTHQNFTTVDGKYETRTHGIVVALPDGITGNHGTLATHSMSIITNWIGKRVYFEEYKEGARIKRDGAMYCFIKIDDIRGYEDVQ